MGPQNASLKAGPTLMAASDLRGQIIELKRPDCGNLKKDTVNGILKIQSGELAGQLAFFPRYSKISKISHFSSLTNFNP